MSAGAAMMDLARRLQPFRRSITGDGVRETLRALGEGLPLRVHEVPSGTPVLDWTVPNEWNPREAWIRGPDGRVVVDFRDHNLHLVNYSAPVHARLPLDELQRHLHSLPGQPDLIPYRTSYYRETWGFCLAHRVRETLPAGEYEVRVDADLRPGSLTYGELAVPGRSAREFLVSTHVCHPALANDNLSGLVVARALAAELLARPEPPAHTVRFLFVPGTIGSITWLARNPDAPARVRGGLVLTCLGDRGGFTYKRTRDGDTRLDRAARRVLAASGQPHRLVDFFPYGYDERQYNSPGFNLPVGCLMRTPHGEFPEYHTSADNLGFLSAASLEGSLDMVRAILDAFDRAPCPVNLHPHGEPQLGKRGLYSAPGPDTLALLWVLNLADGRHSVEDMAERSGLPLGAVHDAAARLAEAGLLAPE